MGRAPLLSGSRCSGKRLCPTRVSDGPTRDHFVFQLRPQPFANGDPEELIHPPSPGTADRLGSAILPVTLKLKTVSDAAEKVRGVTDSAEDGPLGTAKCPHHLSSLTFPV